MGSQQTAYFKSCLGVFQGGGCRAAAFAGAFKEAANRGVSFSEVAGTSAGSIIAALIGSGASPDFVHEELNNLDFKSFLVLPERKARRSMAGYFLGLARPRYMDMYYDQGFYSSSMVQVWVEELLAKLLPGQGKRILFKSLPYPTYIVSTDIERSEAKVWSQFTTPEASVSEAVRASCSIPIFFQPVDRRYVDGGLLSNLPAYVFAEREETERTLASKILAFSLASDITQNADWNTQKYLSKLASTLVDGSQQLQLNLQTNVHVISIGTGDIQATDFDKIDNDAISKLIQNGEKATAQFFDNERVYIRREGNPNTICNDIDEFYTRVTESLEENLERVIIAENNTDWVYSLFPTILAWRASKVRVDAILPANGDHPNHGPYRRRLLAALGVNVFTLPKCHNVPLRATVIIPKDHNAKRAIVGVKKDPKININAVQYQSFFDAVVIQVTQDQLISQMSNANPKKPNILLKSISADLITSRLKKLAQYQKSTVTFAVEDVPVNKLVATSRFTREFKYNQIRSLIELYGRFNLELFEPACVDFGGGRTSIITPPVVEFTDGKYFLIEGSTRATFCRDTNRRSFQCIVVRGVVDPLPSRTLEFSKVRVTGRLLETSKRYEKFDYSLFRHIESTMHPVDGLK